MNKMEYVYVVSDNFSSNDSWDVSVFDNSEDALKCFWQLCIAYYYHSEEKQKLLFDLYMEDLIDVDSINELMREDGNKIHIEKLRVEKSCGALSQRSDEILARWEKLKILK